MLPRICIAAKAGECARMFEQGSSPIMAVSIVVLPELTEPMTETSEPRLMARPASLFGSPARPGKTMSGASASSSQVKAAPVESFWS